MSNKALKILLVIVIAAVPLISLESYLMPILSLLLKRAASTMAGGHARSYASGTYSVAFVTYDDMAKAKTLARDIVKNRVAACVNIVPKITSVYEWEGKVQEDEELLMIIKTETSKVDELTKFVRESHSYDVAEVISMQIDKGNSPYLDWISSSISGPKSSTEAASSKDEKS